MRGTFLIFRRSAFGAALLLSLTVSAVPAQDYPSRPIKFVVGFAPGGATDVVARLTAEKIGALAGQNVIVENKPGANGQVAAEFVMRAEPDGYTLFFTTLGAIALNPNLRAHLTYNPRTDFEPVAMVARNTIMLAVNAGSKTKTFADFLAATKAKKSLSVGVTGVGAATYLSAVLLQKAIGTKLEIVPYRGAAQALSDLLGGHIDAMFGEIPLFLAPMRAGSVRALASTSKARAELIADIPTFTELGLPDVVAENWTGVIAPARTPPAVVEKLGAIFERALTDPNVSNQLARAGVSPSFAGAEPFRAIIDSEIERWGKVIRENGVRVE
ncbi:MAG TPA: tripartite tricarboxylate transporter substrate binding protein [Pseudolabrys sp.]|jgi:tripartite-type tricarboxylate transporter receptor subunit TctC